VRASDVLPAHDPLVRARYPAPSEALEGSVVRLEKPTRDEARGMP
jgi:hypothetical protein